MQWLKFVLGVGGAAIIGVCLTLAIMDGMIEADKLLDAQRRARCDAHAWPKPAQCALYAQTKGELSPAAGGAK